MGLFVQVKEHSISPILGEEDGEERGIWDLKKGDGLKKEKAEKFVVCFYFVRKLFNEEGARHTVVWESGCHEDSGEDDYVSAAEKTVYKDYLPHFLDRERT